MTDRAKWLTMVALILTASLCLGLGARLERDRLTAKWGDVTAASVERGTKANRE